MNLTCMRFKGYTWPHNPTTYTMEWKRELSLQKVPFGTYYLQNLGLTRRLMRGEGAFVGEGAYDEFKKLAAVFYEDSPGILVHPVWQTTTAYFAALTLNQEPLENYVSYSFEFWETRNEYSTSVTAAATAVEAATTTIETEPVYYTVVKGDCMWKIANRYGVTLKRLLALNPQVKNPNLIYVGDRIRVA